MSSLLYEPATGDPHGVLSPAFPFCYPPTVHRHNDWVPADGWREGPAKGIWVGDGPEPVKREALVLRWKDADMLDSIDRLFNVLCAKCDVYSLARKANVVGLAAKSMLGGQLIVWENGP